MLYLVEHGILRSMQQQQQQQNGRENDRKLLCHGNMVWLYAGGIRDAETMHGYKSRIAQQQKIARKNALQTE